MNNLVLFPILCILTKAATASLVAPPDNVTIVCQNGTNIAYWNYTGSSAVEFSVMVNSYRDGKILFQTNTSQHHIDISSETPPDAEDVYTLHLTTLDGFRISDKVSVTFSYGRDLISDVECFMDFPSVNVTIKSNRTMFSFVNPLSLLPVIDYDEYPLDYEQNDTLPSDEEKFYYSVYTTHDQNQIGFECPLEDDVCRGELPFRRCTTLELEGKIDLRYRHSIDICNITPEKDRWPIYLSAVICVIVLVLLVVILLGTRKVVKNFLSSHLPETLTHSRVPGTPCILKPESTRCVKAGSTPLLQTPENSPTDVETFNPTESCPERTHFPIPTSSPSSGDQLEDACIKTDFEPEPLPQIEGDEGSDDGYMQRERITDTPDSSSVNDIAIEIAPGDIVSGYGP